MDVQEVELPPTIRSHHMLPMLYWRRLTTNRWSFMASAECLSPGMAPPPINPPLIQDQSQEETPNSESMSISQETLRVTSLWSTNTSQFRHIPVQTPHQTDTIDTITGHATTTAIIQ